MRGNLAQFVLIIMAALALSACGKKDAPQVEVAPSEEEVAALQAVADEEASYLEQQAAFLDQNTQSPDVIVRPSGLQIRVIKEGEGPLPSLESTVTVNYHGTLIDGTVFDTTRDSGTPFAFTLDTVIAGWREAMTLMRVGSIYQIFLPADLAYGSRGAGDLIRPGSTLVFEVELVAVTLPLNGE